MLDNHRPSPALVDCLLGEQVVAVTAGGRMFVTWDGGGDLSLRVLRPDGRIATVTGCRDSRLRCTADAVASADYHFPRSLKAYFFHQALKHFHNE